MESKTTIKDKLDQNVINREDSAEVKMWMPYKDKVDENYNFISNNIIFKFFSNLLLYGVAYPILFVLNKVCFGFKVNGRENLKKVKGAKITISNHMHMLDCEMVALGLAPEKIFFPTIADNFRIPVVKTLIKLLNAIPIPKGIKGKEKFFKALECLIKEDKTIHFYPEGNLFPYNKELKKFSKGAFKIAFQNNIPVLPMVFTYRSPKGVRKIFNKKALLTLNILEPVYVKNKEQLDETAEKVRKIMQEKIDNV